MRKSRWLAIVMILTVVLTMVPQTVVGAATSPMAFWDVVGGAYDSPVRALYDLGLIAGTSPTTFSPNDPVTRAQMAALLVRALKLTDSTRQSFTEKFSDVPSSFWAFGEIMLAERLGIIRGTSPTTFDPGATVTYPQAVVMTIRALGYDTGLLEYPSGYVLSANELGLLKDLKWDLSGAMTRGEVAVLLANAVFRVPHVGYGKTLSQELFKVPVRLQISPPDAVLIAGSTQLQVEGVDAYGEVLGGLTGTWRVVSGEGSIAASGLLTTVSGSVAVEATLGGLTATREFSVISGLEITPQNASVKPGEQLQLKVVAKGQTNVQLPGVAWSVKKGSATVSGSGLVTVTGAGEISVQARVGSLQTETTLSSISALVIEPASPILTVGDKVKFTVKDGDGKPFTGPATWTVEGAGSIAADGTFTAASGSAPTVRVKSGTISATTPVKVIHRLAVSPSSSVSILKGKTQQFSAVAVTLSGEEVTVPIVWTSTGKVGIIGETGLFVGTQSGSGSVVATYGKLTQTASVAVSGDPYQVVITSDRSNVPANNRSQMTLTAVVKDASGLTVNTETPIQFLLSDSSRGSLSASTVKTTAGVATVTFTPTNLVGNFRVTAVASDLVILAGFLDLSTTLPVAAKIQLTAYPNPIASALNSRSTITAKLLDNEGYEINATTSQAVTLSFSNTTASSLSSGIITIPAGQSKGEVYFHAGNPGSTLLIGAANYPVESVQVSAVTTGAASHVALRSGISDTRADGSAEMVIYAEVQDASGTVRTQDHGVAITLSGLSSDGVTTIGAQTATTIAGVAIFRIRSTKSGTYTYTATSSGLASGTGPGKFTPGNATGLSLSVQPISNIAADASSTVRLRAEIVDVNGNRVTSSAGTITFVKSINGNATSLPAASTVTAVEGVAEVVLTSTIYPGVDTYKATASSLGDSNTVTVTSRITGVPSKVVAEVSTGSAAVGTPVQVKVYLQDSLNQVVTGATSKAARVVPSSPTATVTGSGAFESGVATFTVTDSRSGVVTLSATADGVTSDNSKAISFAAGAAAKIRLKLSSPEMSADNGLSYVQLTADVQDAFGNTVTQAIPITLSTNMTGIANLGSTSLYTGNVVLVRSTAAPGSVVISGAASIPVEPITLSTYVPGAPAKVVVESVTGGLAGIQTTFRVKLLDTNGHLLTSVNTGSALSGVGVVLSGSSGNTQIVSNTNLYGLVNFSANGVTHGSAGFSSGIATFTYINNKAETLSISPVAYYNGTLLAAEAGLITTKPGNPVKLTVTATRAGLSTSTADSTLVEAVMTDIYDNVVTTTEADTFAFSLSGSTYLSTTDQTSVPTTSGRAGIQISSKVHGTGGSTTITVTSAKTGFSGNTTIITDNPPAAPILFVTDNLGADSIVGAGEAGARLVITVDARNSTQTAVAYVNGLQVTLYASASGGTAAAAIGPGQTTLVAFILRADLGLAGVKSIRAVVQNSVASSPVSNSQNLTVQ